MSVRIDDEVVRDARQLEAAGEPGLASMRRVDGDSISTTITGLGTSIGFDGTFAQQ
jgi:hypothetical protein